MADPPRLLILSGPNGAGKTTFSRRLLVAQNQPLPFVNADVEARRILPEDEAAAALPAARAVLSTIARTIDTRASFAVETTLSGQHHLRIARRARQDG